MKQIFELRHTEIFLKEGVICIEQRGGYSTATILIPQDLLSYILEKIYEVMDEDAMLREKLVIQPPLAAIKPAPEAFPSEPLPEPDPTQRIIENGQTWLPSEPQL